MSVYKVNSVLVPVDLSESSLNALEAAVNIAKRHKATLHVLHVDENNLLATEDAGSFYLPNAINATDIITALVGAIHHSHYITPLVTMAEGNVVEMILKSSFLQHADLIVMGAHGASGYRDGFIGNNTYSVIKYASCPVLSVPQKKKLNSFKKILFPIRPVSGALAPYEIVSRFTYPDSVLEILGLTYRMIIDTRASVLDTIVGEIRDRLKEDQVSAKTFWNEGSSIAEEIVRYANTTNPDLVIVSSALDVTSKPRYIGPYAQKIIHNCRGPVLSIKKLAVPSMV